jgi:hypothetical protein
MTSLLLPPLMSSLPRPPKITSGRLDAEASTLSLSVTAAVVGIGEKAPPIVFSAK